VTHDHKEPTVAMVGTPTNTQIDDLRAIQGKTTIESKMHAKEVNAMDAVQSNEIHCFQ